jgi:shikimate kinase
VFNQALNGYYWEALTLNGLLYSSILGYDNRPAIDALEAGAVASGLSGKGPAVVAVVPEERADAVIDAWQKYEGEIIWSKINRSKAHAIRRK